MGCFIWYWYLDEWTRKAALSKCPVDTCNRRAFSASNASPLVSTTLNPLWFTKAREGFLHINACQPPGYFQDTPVLLKNTSGCVKIHAEGGVEMENIGDIIRKHRKLKNLTQEELGNKLFVSKQAISKWENGRSLPDLETIQKLIAILEIDATEILGGTVQEVKKNRKRLTAVVIISILVLSLLCVLLGVRYFEKALIEFGYQDGTNPANQYAIGVSMVELLAAPEKYDGKLVRVIGVGNLEFEGNYLSLSKEDHKYSTGNSIWIELGDRAISYAEAQEYNGKYVIVEGFFDKDNGGHFDMHCGSITNISRYELWERDSAG